MSDKTRDGMLKKIGLGLDAEAFVQSDLGRDLLGVLGERAIVAMDKLKKVNPGEYDSLDQYARVVTALQTEIDRCEFFEQWLVEVIETGRNTEENILQQEAEEQ